jgi:PAS domain S-box-containing protein
MMEKILREGKIEKYDVQFRKKDGSFFWGSLTARVISDEYNAKVFFDGALINVTEIKEYEQKLIEERNFSDRVIESMPGMFWLLDENNRCVRWNKNVETIYGYSKKELQKLHGLKDVTTLETTEILLEAANSAFKGGSGYCEYDILTKYGKKIAAAGDARLVTIDGKKYLASLEIDISKRKKTEDKLKDALEEISQLKERTEAENIYLLDEINRDSENNPVVGESKIFKELISTVKMVAPTGATILLLGESGTGKGVMAKLIHSLSPRNDRPMIKVNCANLPSNLLESILFGHEKGAFTNADKKKIGRFELANKSTIFLDEIAELPLELQSKLLRVIEDGEFERLGGSETIKIDARIIAATNRNLEHEVEEGRFRLDLLYRLNVYPITCPPLRHRIKDIPIFVRFFIEKFNKTLGKSVSKISSKNIESLENYEWPGNIRELQNIIERGIINSPGSSFSYVGFESSKKIKIKPTSRTKTLKEIECHYIVSVLDKTDWVIEGEKGAAKILDLNPSTLRARMRKYGIKKHNGINKY